MAKLRQEDSKQLESRHIIAKVWRTVANIPTDLGHHDTHVRMQMHCTLHKQGDNHVVITEPADEMAGTQHFQDTTCLWCGTSLEPAKPCVQFQSFDAMNRNERAYCCLAHTLRLLDAIILHQPPESCHIWTKDDSHNSAFHYNKRGMGDGILQPCLWCGDTIPSDAAFYAVCTNGVSVHESCGAPMAETLQERFDKAMQEHTDEILPLML